MWCAFEGDPILSAPLNGTTDRMVGFQPKFYSTGVWCANKQKKEIPMAQVAMEAGKRVAEDYLPFQKASCPRLSEIPRGDPVFPTPAPAFSTPNLFFHPLVIFMPAKQGWFRKAGSPSPTRRRRPQFAPLLNLICSGTEDQK